MMSNTLQTLPSGSCRGPLKTVAPKKTLSSMCFIIGYSIIPVRPAQKEILGQKAYPSLDDIHEPIDIIDVFRNPAQIMTHAKEALRIKPNVFWMQLNTENHDAALLLNANGIDVVMNRCIKVDHERLVKKIRL